MNNSTNAADNISAMNFSGIVGANTTNTIINTTNNTASNDTNSTTIGNMTPNY